MILRADFVRNVYNHEHRKCRMGLSQQNCQWKPPKWVSPQISRHTFISRPFLFPWKAHPLQELGWNSFKKIAFQLHPFKSCTSAFTTHPQSIMDPLCPRSTRHWNLVAPLTRLLHQSRPWPCHVLWVGCKRCPDSWGWVKLHHSGGTGSTTPKSIGTNHLFQTSVEVIRSAIPLVFLKNLNKNLVSKISTPNL